MIDPLMSYLWYTLESEDMFPQITQYKGSDYDICLAEYILSCNKQQRRCHII